MKGSATSGAANIGMPAGSVAALMPVASAEQGRGQAPRETMHSGTWGEEQLHHTDLKH